MRKRAIYGWTLIEVTEDPMMETGTTKVNGRYYEIGGLTIRIEADLPISETTFDPKFTPFETDGPGSDNMVIRHHFCLPSFENFDPGFEVYRKAPWRIYKKPESWIYVVVSEGVIEKAFRTLNRLSPGIFPLPGKNDPLSPLLGSGLIQLAVLNKNQTMVDIYNNRKQIFPAEKSSGCHHF